MMPLWKNPIYGRFPPLSSLYRVATEQPLP